VIHSLVNRQERAMNHPQVTLEVTDLSLLSLLAAHELERLQRDEHIAGQYLSALRDQLAQQIPEPGNADIRNIAPSTVQLYRRAVRDATNSDPPDFPALIRELTKLLEQLRVASQTFSDLKGRQQVTIDLQPLLAFLLSIHSQLLAQKQRPASSRGSNRLRV
jgi:hypothetical protein